MDSNDKSDSSKSDSLSMNISEKSRKSDVPTDSEEIDVRAKMDAMHERIGATGDNPVDILTMKCMKIMNGVMNEYNSLASQIKRHDRKMSASQIKLYNRRMSAEALANAGESGTPQSTTNKWGSQGDDMNITTGSNDKINADFVITEQLVRQSREFDISDFESIKNVNSNENKGEITEENRDEKTHAAEASSPSIGQQHVGHVKIDKPKLFKSKISPRREGSSDSLPSRRTRESNSLGLILGNELQSTYSQELLKNSRYSPKYRSNMFSEGILSQSSRERCVSPRKFDDVEPTSRMVTSRSQSPERTLETRVKRKSMSEVYEEQYRELQRNSVHSPDKNLDYPMDTDKSYSCSEKHSHRKVRSFSPPKADTSEQKQDTDNISIDTDSSNRYDRSRFHSPTRKSVHSPDRNLDYPMDTDKSYSCSETNTHRKVRSFSPPKSDTSEPKQNIENISIDTDSSNRYDRSRFHSPTRSALSDVYEKQYREIQRTSIHSPEKEIENQHDTEMQRHFSSIEALEKLTEKVQKIKNQLPAEVPERLEQKVQMIRNHSPITVPENLELDLQSPRLHLTKDNASLGKISPNRGTSEYSPRRRKNRSPESNSNVDLSINIPEKGDHDVIKRYSPKRDYNNESREIRHSPRRSPDRSTESLSNISRYSPPGKGTATDWRIQRSSISPVKSDLREDLGSLRAHVQELKRSLSPIKNPDVIDDDIEINTARYSPRRAKQRSPKRFPELADIPMLDEDLYTREHLMDTRPKQSLETRKRWSPVRRTINSESENISDISSKLVPSELRKRYSPVNIPDKQEQEIDKSTSFKPIETFESEVRHEQAIPPAEHMTQKSSVPTLNTTLERDKLHDEKRETYSEASQQVTIKNEIKDIQRPILKDTEHSTCDTRLAMSKDYPNNKVQDEQHSNTNSTYRATSNETRREMVEPDPKQSTEFYNIQVQEVHRPHFQVQELQRPPIQAKEIHRPHIQVQEVHRPQLLVTIPEKHEEEKLTPTIHVQESKQQRTVVVRQEKDLATHLPIEEGQRGNLEEYHKNEIGNTTKLEEEDKDVNKTHSKVEERQIEKFKDSRKEVSRDTTKSTKQRTEMVSSNMATYIVQEPDELEHETSLKAQDLEYTREMQKMNQPEENKIRKSESSEGLKITNLYLPEENEIQNLTRCTNQRNEMVSSNMTTYIVQEPDELEHETTYVTTYETKSQETKNNQKPQRPEYATTRQARVQDTEKVRESSRQNSGESRETQNQNNKIETKKSSEISDYDFKQMPPYFRAPLERNNTFPQEQYDMPHLNNRPFESFDETINYNNPDSYSKRIKNQMQTREPIRIESKTIVAETEEREMQIEDLSIEDTTQKIYSSEGNTFQKMDSPEKLRMQNMYLPEEHKMQKMNQTEESKVQKSDSSEEQKIKNLYLPEENEIQNSDSPAENNPIDKNISSRKPPTGQQPKPSLKSKRSTTTSCSESDSLSVTTDNSRKKRKEKSSSPKNNTEQTSITNDSLNPKLASSTSSEESKYSKQTQGLTTDIETPVDFRSSLSSSTSSRGGSVNQPIKELQRDTLNQSSAKPSPDPPCTKGAMKASDIETPIDFQSNLSSSTSSQEEKLKQTIKKRPPQQKQQQQQQQKRPPQQNQQQQQQQQQQHQQHSKTAIKSMTSSTCSEKDSLSSNYARSKEREQDSNSSPYDIKVNDLCCTVLFTSSTSTTCTERDSLNKSTDSQRKMKSISTPYEPSSPSDSLNRPGSNQGRPCSLSDEPYLSTQRPLESSDRPALKSEKPPTPSNELSSTSDTPLSSPLSEKTLYLSDKQSSLSDSVFDRPTSVSERPTSDKMGPSSEKSQTISESTDASERTISNSEKSISTSSKTVSEKQDSESNQSESYSDGTNREIIEPHSSSNRQSLSSQRPDSLTERPTSLSDRPTSLSERPHSSSDKPYIYADSPLSSSDRPISLSERTLTQSERQGSTSHRETTSIDSERQGSTSHRETTSIDSMSSVSDKTLTPSSLSSCRPESISDRAVNRSNKSRLENRKKLVSFSSDISVTNESPYNVDKATSISDEQISLRGHIENDACLSQRETRLSNKASCSSYETYTISERPTSFSDKPTSPTVEPKSSTDRPHSLSDIPHSPIDQLNFSSNRPNSSSSKPSSSFYETYTVSEENSSVQEIPDLPTNDVDPSTSRPCSESVKPRSLQNRPVSTPEKQNSSKNYSISTDKKSPSSSDIVINEPQVNMITPLKNNTSQQSTQEDIRYTSTNSSPYPSSDNIHASSTTKKKSPKVKEDHLKTKDNIQIEKHKEPPDCGQEKNRTKHQERPSSLSNKTTPPSNHHNNNHFELVNNNNRDVLSAQNQTQRSYSQQTDTQRNRHDNCNNLNNNGASRVISYREKTSVTRIDLIKEENDEKNERSRKNDNKKKNHTQGTRVNRWNERNEELIIATEVNKKDVKKKKLDSNDNDNNNKDDDDLNRNSTNENKNLNNNTENSNQDLRRNSSSITQSSLRSSNESASNYRSNVVSGKDKKLMSISEDDTLIKDDSGCCDVITDKTEAARIRHAQREQKKKALIAKLNSKDREMNALSLENEQCIRERERKCKDDGDNDDDGELCGRRNDYDDNYANKNRKPSRGTESVNHQDDPNYVDGNNVQNNRNNRTIDNLHQNNGLDNQNGTNIYRNEYSNSINQPSETQLRSSERMKPQKVASHEKRYKDEEDSWKNEDKGKHQDKRPPGVNPHKATKNNDPSYDPRDDHNDNKNKNNRKNRDKGKINKYDGTEKNDEIIIRRKGRSHSIASHEISHYDISTDETVIIHSESNKTYDSNSEVNKEKDKQSISSCYDKSSDDNVWEKNLGSVPKEDDKNQLTINNRYKETKDVRKISRQRGGGDDHTRTRSKSVDSQIIDDNNITNSKWIFTDNATAFTKVLKFKDVKKPKKEPMDDENQFTDAFVDKSDNEDRLSTLLSSFAMEKGIAINGRNKKGVGGKGHKKAVIRIIKHDEKHMSKQYNTKRDKKGEKKKKEKEKEKKKSKIKKHKVSESEETLQSETDGTTTQHSDTETTLQSESDRTIVSDSDYSLHVKNNKKGKNVSKMVEESRGSSNKKSKKEVSKEVRPKVSKQYNTKRDVKVKGSKQNIESEQTATECEEVTHKKTYSYYITKDMEDCSTCISGTDTEMKPQNTPIQQARIDRLQSAPNIVGDPNQLLRQGKTKPNDVAIGKKIGPEEKQTRKKKLSEDDTLPLIENEKISNGHDKMVQEKNLKNSNNHNNVQNKKTDDRRSSKQAPRQNYPEQNMKANQQNFANDRNSMRKGSLEPRNPNTVNIVSENKDLDKNYKYLRSDGIIDDIRNVRNVENKYSVTSKSEMLNTKSIPSDDLIQPQDLEHKIFDELLNSQIKNKTYDLEDSGKIKMEPLPNRNTESALSKQPIQGNVVKEKIIGRTVNGELTEEIDLSDFCTATEKEDEFSRGDDKEKEIFFNPVKKENERDMDVKKHNFLPDNIDDNSFKHGEDVCFYNNIIAKGGRDIILTPSSRTSETEITMDTSSQVESKSFNDAPQHNTSAYNQQQKNHNGSHTVSSQRQENGYEGRLPQTKSKTLGFIQEESEVQIPAEPAQIQQRFYDVPVSTDYEKPLPFDKEQIYLERMNKGSMSDKSNQYQLKDPDGSYDRIPFDKEIYENSPLHRKEFTHTKVKDGDNGITSNKDMYKSPQLQRQDMSKTKTSENYNRIPLNMEAHKSPQLQRKSVTHTKVSDETFSNKEMHKSPQLQRKNNDIKDEEISLKQNDSFEWKQNTPKDPNKVYNDDMIVKKRPPSSSLTPITDIQNHYTNDFIKEPKENIHISLPPSALKQKKKDSVYKEDRNKTKEKNIPYSEESLLKKSLLSQQKEEDGIEIKARKVKKKQENELLSNEQIDKSKRGDQIRIQGSNVPKDIDPWEIQNGNNQDMKLKENVQENFLNLHEKKGQEERIGNQNIEKPSNYKESRDKPSPTQLVKYQRDPQGMQITRPKTTHSNQEKKFIINLEKDSLLRQNLLLQNNTFKDQYFKKETILNSEGFLLPSNETRLIDDGKRSNIEQVEDSNIKINNNELNATQIMEDTSISTLTDNSISRYDNQDAVADSNLPGTSRSVRNENYLTSPQPMGPDRMITYGKNPHPSLIDDNYKFASQVFDDWGYDESTYEPSTPNTYQAKGKAQSPRKKAENTDLPQSDVTNTIVTSTRIHQNQTTPAVNYESSTPGPSSSYSHMDSTPSYTIQNILPDSTTTDNNPRNESSQNMQVLVQNHHESGTVPHLEDLDNQINNESINQLILTNTYHAGQENEEETKDSKRGCCKIQRIQEKTSVENLGKDIYQQDKIFDKEKCQLKPKHENLSLLESSANMDFINAMKALIASPKKDGKPDNMYLDMLKNSYKGMNFSPANNRILEVNADEIFANASTYTTDLGKIDKEAEPYKKDFDSAKTLPYNQKSYDSTIGKSEYSETISSTRREDTKPIDDIRGKYNTKSSYDQIGVNLPSNEETSKDFSSMKPKYLEYEPYMIKSDEPVKDIYSNNSSQTPQIDSYKSSHITPKIGNQDNLSQVNSQFNLHQNMPRNVQNVSQNVQNATLSEMKDIQNRTSLYNMSDLVLTPGTNNSESKSDFYFSSKLSTDAANKKEASGNNATIKWHEQSAFYPILKSKEEPKIVKKEDVKKKDQNTIDITEKNTEELAPKAVKPKKEIDPKAIAAKADAAFLDFKNNLKRKEENTSIVNNQSKETYTSGSFVSQQKRKYEEYSSAKPTTLKTDFTCSYDYKDEHIKTNQIKMADTYSEKAIDIKKRDKYLGNEQGEVNNSELNGQGSNQLGKYSSSIKNDIEKTDELPNASSNQKDENSIYPYYKNLYDSSTEQGYKSYRYFDDTSKAKYSLDVQNTSLDGNQKNTDHVTGNISEIYTTSVSKANTYTSDTSSLLKSETLRDPKDAPQPSIKEPGHHKSSTAPSTELKEINSNLYSKKFLGQDIIDIVFTPSDRSTEDDVFITNKINVTKRHGGAIPRTQASQQKQKETEKKNKKENEEKRKISKKHKEEEQVKKKRKKSSTSSKVKKTEKTVVKKTRRKSKIDITTDDDSTLISDREIGKTPVKKKQSNKSLIFENSNLDCPNVTEGKKSTTKKTVKNVVKQPENNVNLDFDVNDITTDDNIFRIPPHCIGGDFLDVDFPEGDSQLPKYLSYEFFLSPKYQESLRSQKSDNESIRNETKAILRNTIELMSKSNDQKAFEEKTENDLQNTFDRKSDKVRDSEKDIVSSKKEKIFDVSSKEMLKNESGSKVRDLKRDTQIHQNEIKIVEKPKIEAKTSEKHPLQTLNRNMEVEDDIEKDFEEIEKDFERAFVKGIKTSSYQDENIKPVENLRKETNRKLWQQNIDVKNERKGFYENGFDQMYQHDITVYSATTPSETKFGAEFLSDANINDKNSKANKSFSSLPSERILQNHCNEFELKQQTLSINPKTNTEDNSNRNNVSMDSDQDRHGSRHNFISPFRANSKLLDSNIILCSNDIEVKDIDDIYYRDGTNIDFHNSSNSTQERTEQYTSKGQEKSEGNVTNKVRGEIQVLDSTGYQGTSDDDIPPMEDIPNYAPTTFGSKPQTVNTVKEDMKGDESEDQSIVSNVSSLKPSKDITYSTYTFHMKSGDDESDINDTIERYANYNFYDSDSQSNLKGKENGSEALNLNNQQSNLSNTNTFNMSSTDYDLTAKSMDTKGLETNQPQFSQDSKQEGYDGHSQISAVHTMTNFSSSPSQPKQTLRQDGSEDTEMEKSTIDRSSSDFPSTYLANTIYQNPTENPNPVKDSTIASSQNPSSNSMSQNPYSTSLLKTVDSYTLPPKEEEPSNKESRHFDYDSFCFEYAPTATSYHQNININYCTQKTEISSDLKRNLNDSKLDFKPDHINSKLDFDSAFGGNSKLNTELGYESTHDDIIDETTVSESSATYGEEGGKYRLTVNNIESGYIDETNDEDDTEQISTDSNFYSNVSQSETTQETSTYSNSEQSNPQITDDSRRIFDDYITTEQVYAIQDNSKKTKTENISNNSESTDEYETCLSSTERSRGDDTITPHFTTETLTPIPDTEETLTPIPDTEETVTPVPDTEETLTPVPDTEETMTPIPDTEETNSEMIEKDDIYDDLAVDDVFLTSSDWKSDEEKDQLQFDEDEKMFENDDEVERDDENMEKDDGMNQNKDNTTSNAENNILDIERYPLLADIHSGTPVNNFSTSVNSVNPVEKCPTSSFGNTEQNKDQTSFLNNNRLKERENTFIIIRSDDEKKNTNENDFIKKKPNAPRRQLPDLPSIYLLDNKQPSLSREDIEQSRDGQKERYKYTSTHHRLLSEEGDDLSTASNEKSIQSEKSETMIVEKDVYQIPQSEIVVYHYGLLASSKKKNPHCSTTDDDHSYNLKLQGRTSYVKSGDVYSKPAFRSWYVKKKKKSNLPRKKSGKFKKGRRRTSSIKRVESIGKKAGRKDGTKTSQEETTLKRSFERELGTNVSMAMDFNLQDLQNKENETSSLTTTYGIRTTSSSTYDIQSPITPSTDTQYLPRSPITPSSDTQYLPRNDNILERINNYSDISLINSNSTINSNLFGENQNGGNIEIPSLSITSSIPNSYSPNDINRPNSYSNIDYIGKDINSTLCNNYLNNTNEIDFSRTTNNSDLNENTLNSNHDIDISRTNSFTKGILNSASSEPKIDSLGNISDKKVTNSSSTGSIKKKEGTRRKSSIPRPIDRFELSRITSYSSYDITKDVTKEPSGTPKSINKSRKGSVSKTVNTGSMSRSNSISKITDTNSEKKSDKKSDKKTDRKVDSIAVATRKSNNSKPPSPKIKKEIKSSKDVEKAQPKKKRTSVASVVKDDKNTSKSNSTHKDLPKNKKNNSPKTENKTKSKSSKTTDTTKNIENVEDKAEQIGYNKNETTNSHYTVYRHNNELTYDIPSYLNSETHPRIISNEYSSSLGSSLNTNESVTSLSNKVSTETESFIHDYQWKIIKEGGATEKPFW